ncbi:MAG: aminopeptidase [Gammaproteobacteria bacterium]|nr:aminopeptidase [Gammaproteobacteria bacterium]
MRTTHPSISLFVSALMATPALMATMPSLAAPFAFDHTPGRLPKNVIPISYAVAIVPNTAALTMTGRESVVLEVRTATDSIQLNSLNERLHDVRLDGKPVKRVVSSDAQQLTTITLAKPAAPGSHTLSFTYSGKIETEPHGLFLQRYADSHGAQRALLSTQMEATDARRMFPCWDEPAFRAIFRLTMTVPAAWATIGNMPIAKREVHGKLATTTFADSPKMPSYLIEFTGGNLGKVSGTSNGVGFDVWAVSGSEKDGVIALDNAQKILADYDDYFGYRYPLPKLDSIAVPGGFQGAMENWGAITYNDQVLLVSPSSTIADRQEVFSIQAHEMAHQWNGDLVTMAWWDDIWLNESFASWMAAKETAIRNPAWQWWERQDADKERAMSADARASSHAIEQHVTDELQAVNSFDPQITYDKGQAILRMMEAYIGPDTFRAGLRSYMQAHAFSNATTSDLWNALNAASGKDSAEIAADWTERAGFPRVNVAASCDAAGMRTITLSQQRFLLQGEDPGHSHWKIPLQIRSGGDGTPRAVLLTQDGQTAPAGRCDEPLSVDAGALGFYRARYDQATLAINTKDFGRLPDPDRIALLDDQWALVESGVDPLPTYLALATSMGSDLDSRAWTQIAAALATIEYAERGAAGHEAFIAYARSVLRPVFEQLGWTANPGETPDRQALRRTVIQELGSWHDQGIIDEARKRFSVFFSDRKSILPDDQSPILTIVAEYADAETFEKLHAVARASSNETEVRRYYGALMAVRDRSLAEQAAKIALSTEIPPQADSLRLLLILQLAGEHQALSWQIFRANSDRLLQPYVMDAPLIIAQYLPESFWSGVPTAELESWVRSHVPKEMASSVDRGMETVRFRLAEKERLVKAADSGLDQVPMPPRSR